jgi:hypothetical protein
MSLQKGEAMDAPQQLAQYYMMVTCKWRLAALLCFLKTHAHQKVMVFFSTCDSVDFHALLFRETDWPEDLDAAIEDKGDASEGAGGSSSSGYKGGGNDRKHSTGQQQEKFQSNPSSSSSGNSNNFIEPLPSKFTGMFKEGNLILGL